MSGYVPCACRDCFDLAISDSPRIEETWDGEAEEWIPQEVTDPALCLLCKDAGCDTESDCQRPDSYGFWEDDTDDEYLIGYNNYAEDTYDPDTDNHPWDRLEDINGHA